MYTKCFEILANIVVSNSKIEFLKTQYDNNKDPIHISQESEF